MHFRTTSRASLAAVLLLSSACAAGDLKSGPQVGKAVPGPFNPLNVTGPDAGSKRCQV